MLPGDAVAVRAAMNRALAKVDITVVDKAMYASLALSRRTLWQAMRSGWARLRSEVAAERRDEAVAVRDEAPLPELPEELSQALGEALHTPGVEAALIRVFRAELAGAPPA